MYVLGVVIVSGGWCLMGADSLPTTPSGKGACIMKVLSCSCNLYSPTLRRKGVV